MSREISRIGVVGLGTMGAGIVEVFAGSGYDVIGLDADEAAVGRGRGHIEKSTMRAVTRGKATEEERQAILDRIRLTESYDDLADRDLVIEAVPERLELKRAIFEQLDKVVGPDAILATNTSSLSVTDIAVATQRPSQVVGMHFFNPAPVLKFVEVVKTVVTADDVVADAEVVARSLDKLPVVVGDKAGFIANALLFGYLNHAANMFETKYASREDIDAARRIQHDERRVGHLGLIAKAAHFADENPAHTCRQLALPPPDDGGAPEEGGAQPTVSIGQCHFEPRVGGSFSPGEPTSPLEHLGFGDARHDSDMFAFLRRRQVRQFCSGKVVARHVTQQIPHGADAQRSKGLRRLRTKQRADVGV